MNDLSTRQNEIVTLARSSGRVAVDDLARRYEVSPQTIRKDLNELCDRHLLSRVHGGAIIASGVENIAYEARRFVAAAEKRAIGVAAAGLIPNNSSLFINIGTTTEEVANGACQSRGPSRHHQQHSRGRAALSATADRSDCRGRHASSLRRRHRRARRGRTGSPVQGRLRRHRSLRDREPMERFSTFDYRRCRSPSPFLKTARHAMLVADSSKLRRSAPVRIAHIGQVQTWVTDVLGNSPCAMSVGSAASA